MQGLYKKIKVKYLKNKRLKLKKKRELYDHKSREFCVLCDRITDITAEIYKLNMKGKKK